MTENARNYFYTAFYCDDVGGYDVYKPRPGFEDYVEGLTDEVLTFLRAYGQVVMLSRKQEEVLEARGTPGQALEAPQNTVETAANTVEGAES